MRDHMMGWAIPAEPIGPAIRPLQSASKEQNEASLKEFAVLSFETGDHMLPGMKQSDFPKEYDTRVAIEDRWMAVYDKAFRDAVVRGTDRMVLCYDAGAPEGDRTAVVKLTKEKCDDIRRSVDEWMNSPKQWQFVPEEKTAAEIMLKMQAVRRRKPW